MVHHTTINKRTERVDKENQRKVQPEKVSESCCGGDDHHNHHHDETHSVNKSDSTCKPHNSTNNNTNNNDLGPVKVALTHYYRHCGTSASIDYQPQICKDYHQSGSCGYGDTCKYAHIREKQEISKVDSKPIHKQRKILIEKL